MYLRHAWRVGGTPEHVWHLKMLNIIIVLSSYCTNNDDIVLLTLNLELGTTMTLSLSSITKSYTNTVTLVAQLTNLEQQLRGFLFPRFASRHAIVVVRRTAAP